ncbi:MAG: hypothetical protein FD137_7 [Spirochaetes bacterium]|nr:MAG: hypothetical protein FD137_7 [Spirochaetota bacterium]
MRIQPKEVGMAAVDQAFLGLEPPVGMVSNSDLV